MLEYAVSGKMAAHTLNPRRIAVEAMNTGQLTFDDAGASAIAEVPLKAPGDDSHSKRSYVMSHIRSAWIGLGGRPRCAWCPAAGKQRDVPAASLCAESLPLSVV